MSFTLRDYQIKLINDLRVKMRDKKRVIACAATGSGKTKTFIHIAQSRISKGGTVLILSEATKIYKQISKEAPCIDINPDNQFAHVKKGGLHLAMAQTLIRRPHLITVLNAMEENLLIITDEAHIGTHTTALKQLRAAYLIGFTATPDYRFAKHLPVLYDDIVVGPQPAELVESGYLSKYIHWERATPGNAELKISGNEFTEASQEEFFERSIVYDGLFEDLNSFEYRKCIIFTASIHHCQALYHEMKNAGYDCVMQHSKQSAAEQTWHMGQFCGGPVNIMVSVGILTKGFDYPPIDLVVLQRATLSLPLYLQMIGRGSRIIRGVKERFTVLDYGGNYTRHRPWDMFRDWESMWNKKPRKPGVAPMKECPKCGYIMHTSKMECPNCGYKFEHKIVEQPAETLLIERTAKKEGIVGRRISELDHIELSNYATNRQKKAHAVAVAQFRERYQPGFMQAFAAAMNYSPHWLYDQLTQIANGQLLHFEDIEIK